MLSSSYDYVMLKTTGYCILLYVDLCRCVGCRAVDANDDSSGDLDVITGDVTLNMRRTMRKAIKGLGFVSDKYKEIVDRNNA
nr:hypothetical protein [Tanacetum cinerariifolium]